MCLGNHLINTHGYSYEYLNGIGYNNWTTLHDNAHNTQPTKKIVNTKNVVVAPKPIYAPTPQFIVDAMLRIAKVQSSDLLVDMGCGDGNILITAVKRYECRAAGFEIQKSLVDIANKAVKNAGLEKKIKIFHHDMFRTTLKNVDVVTLYLEEELNAKLVPQLNAMKPGSRVVSYAHTVPGLKCKQIYNVTLPIDYNLLSNIYDMSPRSEIKYKIYLYIIGE
jgi:SAM-dependent methyltransferase